ncbi:PhzF family phenazine biosynthesis protein [Listeria rustica]|uniref:PhzF family phenazine biosynthesis isomerase n=1 Tax=Listeria rustica TaxID=2713503 RepID=A0A7W1T5S0_9LIST|nr:PhzF family phenazine biosynthesis isomerase [Listeria rustica]MBA3926021.1 PhzF family phenazine biosynthesis isomerase [Listeria rustica]
MKVYHYDAFSKVPGKGNPAGVVLEADNLSSEDMQKIASQVGFNETAFAMKSEIADIKLRYFTPGHEMNLCGHGTMAAICALSEHQFLTEKAEIRVETKAGILTIKSKYSKDGQLWMTMQQATPVFEAFLGSRADLAQVIGLVEQDLTDEWPIMYGSTGIWTLLVPIKKLTSFQKMKPDNAKFPDLLQEMPRASIHPFCLETMDTDAAMHARHFSSPFSGTIEDPVTGTASGVMGAYYAKYIAPDFDESLDIVVEQGVEVGRDGKVMVHIHKKETTYAIEITGTAVFVGEIG